MTIAMIGLAVLAVVVFVWVLEPVFRARRETSAVASGEALETQSPAGTPEPSPADEPRESSAPRHAGAALVDHSAGGDAL